MGIFPSSFGRVLTLSHNSKAEKPVSLNIQFSQKFLLTTRASTDSEQAISNLSLVFFTVL